MLKLQETIFEVIEFHKASYTDATVDSKYIRNECNTHIMSKIKLN